MQTNTSYTSKVIIRSPHLATTRSQSLTAAPPMAVPHETADLSGANEAADAGQAWRKSKLGLLTGLAAIGVLFTAGCDNLPVLDRHAANPQATYQLSQADNEKGNPFIHDNEGRIMDVTDQTASTAAVALSPDGNHWIAAGTRGVAVDNRWIVGQDGKLLDVTRHPNTENGTQTAVAINNKGQWIVAGRGGVFMNDHWLQGPDGNRLLVSSGGDGGVAVALNNSGHYIVAGPDITIVDGAPLVGGGQFIKATDSSVGRIGVALGDNNHWIMTGYNGVAQGTIADKPAQ